MKDLTPLQRDFRPFLVLGSLILLYFITNLFNVHTYGLRYALTYWPNSGDHINLASDQYDILKDRVHASAFFSQLKKGDAPINTLLFTAFFLVFGKQIPAAVLIIHLIYFALTLVFIFLIARRLADAETGLVAASLFALYPSVATATRIYGSLDFPVVPAITASIYCLLKSDGFRDRAWSLLFGLAAGIGMNMKDTYFGFFIGPSLLAVVTALRQGIDRRKVFNILLSIGVFILLIAPYYFNAQVITKETTELVRDQEGPWHLPRNLRVYTLGLSENHLSPVFLLLLFVGGCAFLKRFPDRTTKWIFLLWTLVPWLIMVFMPHKKVPSYILPLLPAIAIVTALGLARIGGMTRQVLLSSALILGLCHHVAFSLHPEAFMRGSRMPWLRLWYRPPEMIGEQFLNKVTAISTALGRELAAAPRIRDVIILSPQPGIPIKRDLSNVVWIDNERIRLRYMPLKRNRARWNLATLRSEKESAVLLVRHRDTTVRQYLESVMPPGPPVGNVRRTKIEPGEGLGFDMFAKEFERFLKGFGKKAVLYEDRELHVVLYYDCRR